MSQTNNENIDLIKMTIKQEIEHLDKKIEYITTLKDEAIANLMKQKASSHEEEIPGEIDRYDREIQIIKSKHSQVVSKQSLIHDVKEELDDLHSALSDINKELELIQERHESVMEKLLEKKTYLQQRLQSIETMDNMQVQIEGDVQLEIDAYNQALALLKKQREDLLARTDLTASQMDLALRDIDEQIENLQAEHILNMNKLGKVVSDLQDQMSKTLAPDRKEEILKELEKLRLQAINATPSQLLLIEQQMDELNKELEQLKAYEEMQHETEKEQLADILAKRGLKLTESGRILTGSGRILTVDEARQLGLLEGFDDDMTITKEHEMLLKLLEERGLRMTPSGRLQLETGEVYTFEEARQLGLLEGLDEELMKLRGITITSSGRILTKDGQLLSRSQAERLGLLEGLNLDELFALESESVSTTSSTATSLSGMSSADVHYLKNMLGKPLALALAEITAKQPRDPIHYLGHWLYKYRYNQEIDEIKKQELIELLAERERLAAKALHEQAETDVKDILLEILGRVDEQVTRNEIENELARIELDAAATEEEQDDLEYEARDKLGVYTGPTKGQQLT